MSSIEIRPVAVAERMAVANAIRAALLNQPSSEEALERSHASTDASDALAAWEGDRCVGNVAGFRFEMTVPGGSRLPTSGVTRVGVLPTHTRRGLLRTMMERLLREAHERGQPIAALLASEAPIYGRFGFGLATEDASVRITTATAKPLRGTPVGGSMRLLDRAEADRVVPEIYERCATRRPGTMSRDGWMWEWELANVARPTSKRPSRGEFVAVHTDEAGIDDGYVRYQTGWDDDFGDDPVASGKILELLGVDARAERALWAYLLDVDLIRTWIADSRPVDDPIRRTFHDRRAYATKRRIDHLWVRLLDVDVALAARTYGAAEGAVRIGVRDPWFDHNVGVWTVCPTGAERSDDGEADLTVDIDVLSAAYLGGVSWREMLDSAEIDEEVDPGTIERLDGLFAVRPLPFCGTEF